ncbi:MAG: hypothetical protein Q8N23_16740 [Archangium sp.]|nr:hypothetical protein [Archangium sp.]MDP3574168.1 hypothetical protein [Archangium sp.]
MLTLLCLAALASPGPGYTLHEWGTFTSVAGEDGKPIEWRPLAGPSDLPSFIYTSSRPGLRAPRQQGKGELRGTVRMETPVIYFYASEPLEVSLAVSFKNGVVTEWYPWARAWTGSRLDWGTFKIVPLAQPSLLREPAPSHYYPAREVEAAPVRVCGTGVDGKATEEWERFLFYRGVGSFALPLTVRVQGSTLELDHLEGEALIFERAGSMVGVSRVKGKTTTSRPPLTGSVEDAHRLVLEALVGAGLYEPEAKAMLETWRDSWFEEGLRVIYLVPRAMTDEVLPLQVSPAPSKSVRVLVGRFEVLTAERVEAARVLALSSRDASKVGRFAEPLLTRAASKSPADKKVLQQLIAKWAASSAQVLSE